MSAREINEEKIMDLLACKLDSCSFYGGFHDDWFKHFALQHNETNKRSELCTCDLKRMSYADIVRHFFQVYTETIHYCMKCGQAFGNTAAAHEHKQHQC